MTEITLRNNSLEWRLDWSNGRLESVSFNNKLSGNTLTLSDNQEIALVFSASRNQVREPFTYVSDFQVHELSRADRTHAVFQLQSPSAKIKAIVHYRLEGPTRRKWVEVQNTSARDMLLLDVKLDSFSTDASATGGGAGQPVFLGDESFAAIEHPAGENQADRGHIQLVHFPGRLLSPGERFKSHASLVSVAEPGQALEHFVSYIKERSIRPEKVISVYTPFGINNQWGLCPTLDDEETLDVLGLLEKWQRRGVHFDYFTLDTGWVDPNSDLTRFKPTCYPNGPGKIVKRVKTLGMKFGLWFATSWAAESCWDYPPAWTGQSTPPPMTYRNGCPARNDYSRSFCMASEPYFHLLRNAVLYHIRKNHVRLLKFDGGKYRCESTEHGHLPGKYSVERMYENLIKIANSARAAAPDVFIMWYWGLRSPFWSMHGDSIFESGLHMEGSGTSRFPSLYYRDSVTLGQDQNAQHAKTIPPVVKDSLGVWLADTLWGNYMGRERWKEALVMDLARGNMLFPNLWGNLYHLTEEDVDFLAWISALAKKNQSVFLKRHKIAGCPWKNEVYGYAHCIGNRGFLFLNNAHFASRQIDLCLDASLGLQAKPGTPVYILSLFPDRKRLLRDDGLRFRIGDRVELWLRPFEVLMLEMASSTRGFGKWPIRAISKEQAADLGISLSLRSADERIDVKFADAARFAQQGFRRKIYSFETTLPSLKGETPILCIVIRLRQGDDEWRYSPVVAEIVQAATCIDGQNVQLIPIPNARQFGNTQKAGCSWVVYKVRLNRLWSHKSLTLAVAAYLPEKVEALVEAWVVKRWWKENTRPAGDGYYADNVS